MDSGTNLYSSRHSLPLEIVIVMEPSMGELCSDMCLSLTQSHAFLDGNKRVAAAITEAFVETNGFELTMTNEELVDLFVKIARAS
jgi:death-on-curing protein